MTTVIVTQPNFLPWLGYLAQLAYCDIFVCLDTVQFNRREWQNRNRIVSREGKLKYLTVDVQKTSRESLIRDISISETFDSLRLTDLTAQLYRGCAGRKRGLEFVHNVCSLFYLPKKSLAEANYEQILFFVELFGLKTRVLKASKIEPGLSWSTASERILRICQALGATIYRSSIGAHSYMKSELSKFTDAGISVEWQHFVHRSYVKEKNFISHLSMVDFLCHHNEVAMLNYIYECNKFIKNP